MVVVIVDLPRGTERQYEQITAELFPGGKLPDGWSLHVAGPTESGWRVVNVIPSQERFEAFAREQLFPAAQAAGDAPPELSFFPRPPPDPELKGCRTSRVSAAEQT